MYTHRIVALGLFPAVVPQSHHSIQRPVTDQSQNLLCPRLSRDTVYGPLINVESAVLFFDKDALVDLAL